MSLIPSNTTGNLTNVWVSTAGVVTVSGVGTSSIAYSTTPLPEVMCLLLFVLLAGVDGAFHSVCVVCSGNCESICCLVNQLDRATGASWHSCEHYIHRSVQRCPCWQWKHCPYSIIWCATCPECVLQFSLVDFSLLCTLCQARYRTLPLLVLLP